jgi:molybdopterin converting factor subunit 1
MALMRVRVLFFGQLREMTGLGEAVAEIPEASSVEDVFAAYEKRFPALTETRKRVAVSVNQSFAAWNSRVSAGDEVAFLPPVSGGEGPGAVTIGAECRLVRNPIPVGQIVAGLKAAEDGAVAVFEGIVRNHSHGRRTAWLEYESYESMALAKLQEIAAHMRSRFGVREVALWHRLGRMEISETSVLVAVASAHRAAAFAACRYGIDTLKALAPIWKKEIFADGGVEAAAWAEGAIPSDDVLTAQPETEPQK